MSYRLEPDELLTSGIRRIAQEQISDALAYLGDSEESPDEAIHEARKCFKKVRAVMRLVRDEIGEEIYQRENVTYRDAGRELSAVRDSHVMVETLDAIADTYDDYLAEDPFRAARQSLAAAHQHLLQQVLDEGKMAAVAGTVSAARGRLDTLPVNDDGFAALRGGLRRVYKRGYKRLDKANENSSAENLHEWRKRVKYLWYHTRILRPIWKEPLAALADEIHVLSDYLGDDHDLAELKETFHDQPSIFQDADARRLAEALIDRDRQRLEKRAFPLGRRIYTEEPDEFVCRMSGYWDVWQWQKG
jgi:CHAD domain-containing protein